jgi:hypothetical protein
MAQANLDKKYLRPSMIILCENEPIAGTGGDAGKWDLTGGVGGEYLYLTDDNRDAVSVSPNRIEYKQRMLNGRMRSYYVTDKNTFSTSWDNMPSRANRYPTVVDGVNDQITSDGFGAGQDIKSWYETYTGDFWMLLVYDGVNDTSSPSNQVEKYNVMFEDFTYDILKRGQFNDLWSVSISLVEV